jgi:hypothetical protein
MKGGLRLIKSSKGWSVHPLDLTSVCGADKKNSYHPSRFWQVKFFLEGKYFEKRFYYQPTCVLILF